MTDVARALGVSPSTVSNAYNRPDQLSAALRARVLEEAARLGYGGPDPMGRVLRYRRAGAVGVLYANRLSYAFDDPAAVQFLQGLTAATEDAGLGLVLVPGTGDRGRDAAAVRRAVVDGLVIDSLAEDDPVVEAATARGLPAVVVDQPRRQGVAFVGIDDQAGARAAAAHLVALGHRRVGVVSFALATDPRAGIVSAQRRAAATYPVTRARLAGYAAAGLRHGDVTVYECPGSTPELGEAAGHVLLAADPRPTAVLALSDQLAVGVLAAARRRGLAVPADLSVVGFDDVPAAARTDPPLTTVGQPSREKGLVAGRLLVAALAGEADTEAARLLPTRLVVRASTAPPPG